MFFNQENPNRISYLSAMSRDTILAAAHPASQTFCRIENRPGEAGSLLVH
jgi:hypothetical protein